jgi:hypothetical protein
MPEAKFMLSNESVDDLTIDLEVSGIRAIMLARAARLHHGYVETKLQEKVSKLERAKADLKVVNKELMGQVESLQASIEKDDDLKKAEEAR